MFYSPYLASSEAGLVVEIEPKRGIASYWPRNYNLRDTTFWGKDNDQKIPRVFLSQESEDMDSHPRSDDETTTMPKV